MNTLPVIQTVKELWLELCTEKDNTLFRRKQLNTEKAQDEDLLYVLPTIEYTDEIQSYRQEMLEAESSFDGCYCMKRVPDTAEFVKYCMQFGDPEKGSNARGAKGIVLLCIRNSDCRMVGCMQLHYVLADRMKNHTGQVGYSVRPSERRKGYATKMLRKAVELLSEIGFAEIEISCLPENEASRKTILANGGKYRETVYLAEDEVYLERYRIDAVNRDF